MRMWIGLPAPRAKGHHRLNPCRVAYQSCWLIASARIASPGGGPSCPESCAGVLLVGQSVSPTLVSATNRDSSSARKEVP